ncbi:hypothetical protein ACFL0F_00280 [Patescibacteria group bacterium]
MNKKLVTIIIVVIVFLLTLFLVVRSKSNPELEESEGKIPNSESIKEETTEVKVEGSEITLEGTIKTGKQLEIGYCENGNYLTESVEVDHPVFLRTSDGKRKNGEFVEYVDNKVMLKGFYPPDPPIDCSDKRCACEDYISVTSIEIKEGE